MPLRVPNPACNAFAEELTWVPVFVSLGMENAREFQGLTLCTCLRYLFSSLLIHPGRLAGTGYSSLPTCLHWCSFFC